MKRFLVTMCIVTAATLVMMQAAGAQDPTEKVVAVLKSAPVYVEPGTPGTDNNTAAFLEGQLSDGDNIYLVVLPAPADNNLDANAVTEKIARRLGNKAIVGLTLGSEGAAFSPNLPAGVAADLMHRAASVSNGDPITILNTFARNIHIWQTEHPEADTTSPPKKKEDSGLLLPIGLGTGLSAALLGTALVIGRRNRLAREQTSADRTKFKVPERLVDDLERIAQLRRRVHNEAFKQQLFTMCDDIERYFSKYSSNVASDAAIFEQHLEGVARVLQKYVDVQTHPRDFNDPNGTMQRGLESIVDFAEWVIRSIRNGNDSDLLDFTVDTKILGAKKRA